MIEASKTQNSRRDTMRIGVAGLCLAAGAVRAHIAAARAKADELGVAVVTTE